MRFDHDVRMRRLVVGVGRRYKQGVGVVCISVSSLIPIRNLEISLVSCPSLAHLLGVH